MSLYDLEATSIDGAPQRLGDFRGKTLLIVNVASKCGFTPQYEGLEALYRAYKDRGLVILGFPCDQFGHQEPGDEAQIRSFCSSRYGVSFPMFAKIEVNGSGTHPLYRHLKREARGILGSEAVKWNFTKFLVDKQGQVRRRFAPTASPEAIGKEVAELL
jgi:glutathione peroxidase